MADESQMHMIRRQVFDLHLNEEKQAKALQDKLSSIYSSELTPIIESVLDEFSRADEMIRFDQLEVDLGDIPPDQFLEQFKKRLRLTLRQVLAAEIAQHNQSTALPKLDGPRRIPIVQAKLDFLIHFLEYGYLSPWARGKDIELPSLFVELISHEPVALSRALRHISDPLASARRLVEQFSGELQYELQELLVPGNAALIEQARILLEKTFQDHISASIPIAQVRKEFAIATFHYALEHEVVYGGLDREKWIEKLVQNILMNFGALESQEVIQSFTNPQNSFFSTFSSQQLNTLKADWIKRIASETDLSVEDNTDISIEEEDKKGEIPSSLDLPSSSSILSSSIDNEETPNSQIEPVEFQSPKANFPIQAQIDLVIHRLIKDEWPWWAPEILQSDIPDKLLNSLIEEQAKMVTEQFFQALSQQIRSGGYSHELIGKRISQQLSVSTQLSLIGLMTPQLSGFLFLLNRFIEESFVSDKPVPSVLWERIWTYILEQEHSSTSSELLPLLKYVLPALAKSQNISPNIYYQKISKRIFLQRQQGETRFLPIQSLIIQLMQEEDGSSKLQNKNLETEGESIEASHSDSHDEETLMSSHSEDEESKETILATPSLETPTSRLETMEEQIEKEADVKNTIPVTPSPEISTSRVETNEEQAEKEQDPITVESQLVDISKDRDEPSSTSLKEESSSTISSETPIPIIDSDPLSPESQVVDQSNDLDKSRTTFPEDTDPVLDSQEPLVPPTQTGEEQDEKETESLQEKRLSSLDPESQPANIPQHVEAKETSHQEDEESENDLDTDILKEDNTPLLQEIQIGALPQGLIEDELSTEALEEVKQRLRMFSYFLRYGSFPSDKPAPSQQVFEEMIMTLSKDHPQPLAQLFGKMILVVDIRNRIMNQLSDRLFETLIHLLPSVQGSDLVAHYKALRILVQESPDLISTGLLKQELLAYVIAQIGRTPIPYQYIHKLIKRLGRQGIKVRTTVLLPLIQAAEKSNLSHKKELVEIFSVINQELMQLEQVASTRPPVQATQRSKPLGDLPINIENAGLVLIWPFIPHYFKMLEFLTPMRKFKRIEDAKRAVHLLQYIVRKSTDEPEERLVLNKLMCGVPLAEPIERSIEITDKEAELAESLLQAACGQWTAMKNATPDGLRGSFLIRNGKLDKKLKNWEVKVEKKPYDMLIDRLPWSISMVKFPWMDSILQVEWR